MSTNNKKVQEKYPDFVKEITGLDKDALKQRIVSLQQGLQLSEAHKADNEALADAKASVKELSGPYRDVSMAVKLKTKYIIDLLDEK